MNEDIETIIDIAKHYKYRESNGKSPFNRVSVLPETKRHMKMAIKDRMRFLVDAYISLASFIDDDLVDIIEDHLKESSRNSKEKIREIYDMVFNDIQELRKEMEDFRPAELPTDESKTL